MPAVTASIHKALFPLPLTDRNSPMRPTELREKQGGSRSIYLYIPSHYVIGVTDQYDLLNYQHGQDPSGL